MDCPVAWPRGMNTSTVDRKKNGIRAKKDRSEGSADRCKMPHIHTSLPAGLERDRNSPFATPSRMTADRAQNARERQQLQGDLEGDLVGLHGLEE